MHAVVTEPIEHLDHEHVPTCEMEFRVSARDFDKCDKGASWYVLCPNCPESGYSCDDCRVRVERTYDVCGHCCFQGPMKWVRL